MKNVLITGGAGFIGSNLVDHLLRDETWAITCIDNFDNFYSASVKRKNISNASKHSSFQLLEGDIRDVSFLNLVFQKPYDVIVHLAARAGVRPSIQNPALYEDVNIKGTLNLLEKAKEKDIKQFVFASSSSVYGINPHRPWSESDAVLNPISPYAATKVAGELLGHTYASLYNLRFIALRFFTTYGPRQRPDLAIHKFFRQITNNEPIPFYGDGTTSRDYTFVEDIVQGLKAAMQYEQSTYEVINLGNNHAYTLMELIAAIEKTLNMKAQLNRLPAQPGDAPHTYADITKAKRLLNYVPSTSLESGLEKFRQWFVDNQAS